MKTKNYARKSVIITQIKEMIGDDLTIAVRDINKSRNWVKNRYPDLYPDFNIGITYAMPMVAEPSGRVDAIDVLLKVREYLLMLGRGPHKTSLISKTVVDRLEKELRKFGNTFVETPKIVKILREGGNDLLAKLVRDGSPNIAHTGPHGRPPKASSVLDVIVQLRRYAKPVEAPKPAPKPVEPIKTVEPLDCLRKFFGSQTVETPVFYLLAQTPGGKAYFLRVPVVDSIPTK